MYVLYARKNSKHFLVISLMFSGRVDPVVQKSDKKGFWKYLPQRAGFAVPGPYIDRISTRHINWWTFSD